MTTLVRGTFDEPLEPSEPLEPLEPIAPLAACATCYFFAYMLLLVYN